MRIDSIDHWVLTVRDIQASCIFYGQVLGMEVATCANNQHSLLFGSQKMHLQQYGQEFEPKAHVPLPGSTDLCFMTSVPLLEVMSHLSLCDVPITEGPVYRMGATGPILSIYIRDPDSNLIEIANPISAYP